MAFCPGLVKICLTFDHHAKFGCSFSYCRRYQNTSWDGGVADAPESRSSPRVTIPNFVAVGRTIWAYVGSQNWRRLGPAPWDEAWLADPLKHAIPQIFPYQPSSLQVKPFRHGVTKMGGGHWGPAPLGWGVAG